MKQPDEQKKVTLADIMSQDGDIVIIARNKGRSMGAWIRHGDSFHEMPAKWESRYDVGPKETGTGHQIGLSAHVDWTRKEWRDIQDELNNGGSADASAA